MKNKKLSSLLALLSNKKFLIPAAFLIAFGAIGGLFIKASFNIHPTAEVKGTQGLVIDAGLNLSIDEIKCESDTKSLIVDITKPSDGSQFFTTDTINFEGKYTYACKDVPDFKFSWTLDNSDKEFSTNKDSASLNNLAAGDHVVEYTVSNSSIKSFKEVKFKVNQKIFTVQCYQGCDSTHVCANGLSCQSGKCVLASNPGSNSCQPNKSPTVSIDSWNSTSTDTKNPSVIYADQSQCSENTNALICQYFTYFYIYGSGQDPEDGTLSGNSLSWDYDNGSLVHMGNGTQIIRYKLFGPQTCSSAPITYNITLTGTDTNGSKSTKTISVTVERNC